ncbi:MAG: peptide ABC transporter substrate-binding protein [Blastocatellia bacterium]
MTLRSCKTSPNRCLKSGVSVPVFIIAVSAMIFAASCDEFEKPQTEPFFSETSPPPKQEFRWSNGRLPKNLDPAMASAAPETDLVRAVFEGLTETRSADLKEIPAAAEKWKVSEDGRIWTFTIRENARWSNGKPVTAADFVRSWNRFANLGERAAHRNLLDNIARLAEPKDQKPNVETEPVDFLQNAISVPNRQPGVQIASNANPSNQAVVSSPPTAKAQTDLLKLPIRLDVVAESERILKVRLERPDKDFAKLVAHPVFRPVFEHENKFDGEKIAPDIITNGAFKIVNAGREGISLERSDTYWNRDSVKLEHVRFVPAEKAEVALEAYRTGKIDAVTNADFAPLAQKLLTPYGDFRKTTHAALNFYELNYEKPPYHDRRVRQALAMSIERERLTDGELEGTTEPAFSFLPFATESQAKVIQDKERARELLDEAGYPKGENFPVIRLVINRNDAQQRVARSVARMWKQNLNLDTEIIIKETAELADAREKKDFDVLRRGVVLPTSDEKMGIAAIFGLSEQDEKGAQGKIGDAADLSGQQPTDPSSPNANTSTTTDDTKSLSAIIDEEDAIFELRAIPLYFPTSFSLVKPYVSGFEMNSLDAPSLLDVAIDNSWQPKGS